MVANRRRICCVTGSRAEYGLLRHLLIALREADDIELQLVAAGMHLSQEFGLTYREIEHDGFVINKKVEHLLSSDTSVAIAKSTGLGMIGFADVFEDLEPDLLLVLGDRFETFAAVAAALFRQLPVAHLHGGEVSVGAFDEGLRHAITKLSHLHFVATEEFRQRVIQLGESPEHVFMVGGLGVDAIHRTTLLEKTELEQQLSFQFAERNLLIAFHPATLEAQSSASQFGAILSSLEKLDNTGFIFTGTNADTDGRAITEMIREFVNNHSEKSAAFDSLGQVRFWSVMKCVDAIVGNSSSGLLEAPSLGTASINIGNRQAGRPAAKSVIQCPPDELDSALTKLYSPEFQAILQMQCENPYDPKSQGADWGTVEEITRTLRTCTLDNQLIQKRFHDLPFDPSHLAF